MQTYIKDKQIISKHDKTMTSRSARTKTLARSEGDKTMSQTMQYEPRQQQNSH
jgi:hypothetical protein